MSATNKDDDQAPTETDLKLDAYKLAINAKAELPVNEVALLALVLYADTPTAIQYLSQKDWTIATSESVGLQANTGVGFNLNAPAVAAVVDRPFLLAHLLNIRPYDGILTSYPCYNKMGEIEGTQVSCSGEGLEYFAKHMGYTINHHVLAEAAVYALEHQLYHALDSLLVTSVGYGKWEPPVEPFAPHYPLLRERLEKLTMWPVFTKAREPWLARCAKGFLQQQFPNRP